MLPKPCTHQETLGQPQHPFPQLPLLTLGGPLGCLGPLHLRKHLLARASHQGQVGVDADLSILLWVLVQTGERRSLAWVERRPSPGAHLPPPPSTQKHDIPRAALAQQVALLPGASSHKVTKSPLQEASPTCSPAGGLWEVVGPPPLSPPSPSPSPEARRFPQVTKGK